MVQHIISAKQDKEMFKELDKNGTSFFGHTFKATPDQLRKKFGKETYSGYDVLDKSEMNWNIVLEITPDLHILFTIYDWKYYRHIQPNETIVFHIGARNAAESSIANFYMSAILNKDFSENGVKYDVNVDYNAFMRYMAILLDEAKKNTCRLFTYPEVEKIEKAIKELKEM